MEPNDLLVSDFLDVLGIGSLVQRCDGRWDRPEVTVDTLQLPRFVEDGCLRLLPSLGGVLVPVVPFGASLSQTSALVGQCTQSLIGSKRPDRRSR